MSHKLPNYLRTYRKHAGLTQKEVAFLLGCGSGAKVSRYEQWRRAPEFPTALAYEAIFGAPCRDIFAGAFESAERSVRARAKILAERLGRKGGDQNLARKLQRLEAIAAPKPTRALHSL